MSGTMESLGTLADHWWPYVLHATWQSALLGIVVLAAAWMLRQRSPSLRYGLLLVALLKFAVPPMLSFPTGVFGWAAVPRAETPIEAAVTMESAATMAVEAPQPDLANAPAAPSAPASSGWMAAVTREAAPEPSAPYAGPTAVATDVPIPATPAGRPLETVNPQKAVTAVPVPLPSWKEALLLVHALGALVVAAWVVHSCVGMRRLARRCRRVEDGDLRGVFDDLSRRMGLRRRVRLLVTPEDSSPLAYGLIRPTVVLSEPLLERLPEEEVAVVLAHELAHHKRKDAWLIVLENLMLIAWWFNPVLWPLVGSLRRRREDCCDDLVLTMDIADNAKYCGSLLNAASSVARLGRAPAALGFADRFHPLARRLKRIMDSTVRRSPRLSLAGLVVVVALAVVALPGLRVVDAQESGQTRASAPDGGVGPKGKVLRFDGKDDYIHFDPAAHLDLTSNLTVSAWVNVHPECEVGSVVFRGHRQRGHDPYHLLVKDGRMWLTMDGGSGENRGDQVSVSCVFEDGWHHWTAVCDEAAGKLCLYEDGEKVSEGPAPAPCRYDTSAMYNEIGAIDSGTWGSTWGFFKGEIDQVSIWNLALGPDQVEQVFARGLEGDEPGLVGLWLFDEDGQTVHDTSSFRYHATLGRSPDSDASDPERVLADAGPASVVSIEVPAKAEAGHEWFDTGIAVTIDADLEIAAEGTASWDPGLEDVGPQGAGRTPQESCGRPEQFLLPTAPCGGLVGRVGESGTPFFVGARGRITAESAGALFLGINDRRGHFDDNQGAFRASVSVASGVQGAVSAASMADTELRRRVAGDAKACRESRNTIGRSFPFLEKNADNRLALWREGARRNIPEAQLLLGLCYSYGIGAPKSDAKEAELLQKAAEQGDATAMYNLGISYRQGKGGLPRDMGKAFELYRRAAELGDSHAMWEVGRCYLQGTGVAKDGAQAIEWFRKSAELGNARGMMFLGECYQAGEVIEKNEAEAGKWFQKASDLGYDPDKLPGVGRVRWQGETPAVRPSDGKLDGGTTHRLSVQAKRAKGEEWYPTGVTLAAGADVAFAASGTVSWDPDSPDVPPQGAGRTPNDSTRRPHEFLMPSAPCGGLVGKIGEDGKAFFIGTSLRISAPNDGELYLATNDRAPHFEDNEGQFEVMLTIGAGARDGATAPPVAEPLEPVPAVEEAPGKVIFQGRYRHWRGGREIAEPGALWLKQQEDGTLAAIAHLPFTNSTSVAQGDKDNRLTRYETRSESSDGRPGYRIALECLEDKALATRSGLREDWDNKELAVPGGAVFDPNTRPDPYCAANILLRGFAVEEGQSKEFEVYDWDNSGNGLASYRIRIAHQGNEQVTVSAGTFEANHIVLTQLASADTWFKKREGHVTDFWVLDNGVIVRILRHREPYELQLLDWRAEEELPGLLKKPAKVVTGRLTVVSAEYGAGDKWVDVTEHVRQRIQNNTLTVRASNDLAGDPIYGVSKKLKVHYRVGDTSYVTSVDEMETLCLPEAGTVQSTGRGATPGGQLGVGGHDLATEVEKEIGEHYGKASPEVQEYIRWTATNFGRGGLWLPESAFDGIEPSEREARIQGCLEILQTDYGRHMCESLAAAGVLKDKRLLPGLARVATYQQEGGQDNRAKWMATAALGRLGDESAIPALIPLVDHYNKNTRLWAQASLARLTGEGFGDDKQAWATWWNESGKGPAIDAAALSPAVDSGPSAHHPLEPIPTAAELPGTLVFHGRYTHRSRGRDYDQPGSLWVKQQEDGAVVALSHMPFFNETALAVGDATHRPIHYAASRQAMGRYPAFEARLDFHEDKAIQIRHWGDEKDDKEYPIESGALFDLNSRPDPYAVCNILIRRFALEPGESKEFTMCDWGTSEHGEGTLPSYRVRVEHKGKGEVTVPGGAFEANHLVLTQLTSADTWFKKRADHVTDFWVLDNGVIVRILRHREPYEIELLDWATPEAPPGMLERKSTPTPLP